MRVMRTLKESKTFWSHLIIWSAKCLNPQTCSLRPILKTWESLQGSRHWCGSWAWQEGPWGSRTEFSPLLSLLTLLDFWRTHFIMCLVGKEVLCLLVNALLVLGSQVSGQRSVLHELILPWHKVCFALVSDFFKAPSPQLCLKLKWSLLWMHQQNLLLVYFILWN